MPPIQKANNIIRIIIGIIIQKALTKGNINVGALLIGSKKSEKSQLSTNETLTNSCIEFSMLSIELGIKLCFSSTEELILITSFIILKIKDNISKTFAIYPTFISDIKEISLGQVELKL